MKSCAVCYYLSELHSTIANLFHFYNFPNLKDYGVRLLFLAEDTQQDYYGPQYGTLTLLHNYCTGTYTKVEVPLLLWSTHAGTPTELLCRYYMAIAEILQRSSAVNSV